MSNAMRYTALAIAFLMLLAGRAQAANNPPAAGEMTVYGLPGEPLAFTLSASDSDDDVLTFQLGLSPSGLDLAPTLGSLDSPGSGEWTYTPNSAFPLSDSFAYTAYDGQDYSNTAVVTLVLRDGGESPATPDITYFVGVFPAHITIILTATDRETQTDDLDISLSSSPAHGQLVETGGRILRYEYYPADGFHGEDSFTYNAFDGVLLSETGTVTITVTRPPEPQPCSATVFAFDSVLLELSASDPDGDELSFSFRNGPYYGSISETPSGFTYYPDPGFAGTDEFEYVVADSYYQRAAGVTVTALPAGKAGVNNRMDCWMGSHDEIPPDGVILLLFAAAILVVYRRSIGHHHL